MTGLIINSYIDIKTISCESSNDPGSSTQCTEATANEDKGSISTSQILNSDSEGEDVNEYSDSPTQSTSTDDVQRYAKELMSPGSIYCELCDGIRERTGPRIFHCFKYMLPLFNASDRVNYSSEIFCILAQHRFLFSERLSHQLQWSRFVNTQGKPGKNIPCDLHVEHMNRIVKNAVRGLGANKSEKTIIRTGKCVDTIAKLLTKFDEDQGVKSTSNYHSTASEAQDLELLLNELGTHINPFMQIPNRHHNNIKVPKTTLLQQVDPEKFSSWLDQKWCALLAGLL